MIIVGGSYLEICTVPEWYRLLGSGGRAALVIASSSRNTNFHTYASARWASDVEQTMRSFGVIPHITLIAEEISFYYFHPLSEAVLSPGIIPRNDNLHVSGDVVLRFGFVEGDAVVDADYALYDVQGGNPILPFEHNGSRAKHLGYVLNQREIQLLTAKPSMDEAASALLSQKGTDIVAVKRGVDGVVLYEKGKSPATIPAYWSDRVFKIGSGDIFSAVFSQRWAEQKIDARQAADDASRAVAHYVETRTLSIPNSSDLAERIPIAAKHARGPVYIAGPFFTIANRWLIEEAINSIEELGGSVFSPLHDVGFGDADYVANKDLEGLRGCAAVLALIDGNDPGTLFEVGYARERGIPVVAFGENKTQSDMTMLVGTGCEFVDDFATAIYRAIWATR